MTNNTTTIRSNFILKGCFLLGAITCLFPFVNAPIALVGGFLFAHFGGHPYLKYNSKVINFLLKAAIIGLGFGISLQEASDAGKTSIGLTVFSIALVLSLGYLWGKFLNVELKASYLISTGTAICGGSAIAAIKPIIKANEKDTSIALGVIFLLNSVALLIFPVIGQHLDLTQAQFGLWAAIAIHDTSSVVGAATTYGDEALKLATTVKLARALWIIPLSFLTILLFNGSKNKIKIPWFILLFIAVICLNSSIELPLMLQQYIPRIAKSVLVLTLFLVGAGISVEQIKSTGWPPMILGLLLWLTISIVSLLLILGL